MLDDGPQLKMLHKEKLSWLLQTKPREMKKALLASSIAEFVGGDVGCSRRWILGRPFLLATETDLC